MSDQKKHWNAVISSSDVFHSTESQTDFAEEVLSHISNESTILELGCGIGADAELFAKAGNHIVATDFSDVAIQKAIEISPKIDRLTFAVMDMTEPFPYQDNSFSVVYARLSLHYFSDSITRSIIKEIHRVLKPGGKLFFLCKSTNDSLYGEGEKMGMDMYKRKGKIRHFFSERYCRKILNELFMIEHIVEHKKVVYTRDSVVIRVFAQSKK